MRTIYGVGKKWLQKKVPHSEAFSKIMSSMNNKRGNKTKKGII